MVGRQEQLRGTPGQGCEEAIPTSTVTHLSSETQGTDVRIDTFFSKQTKANWSGV